MSRFPITRPAIGIAGLALVTACSGSGGSGTPVAPIVGFLNPTPTPVASPVPTIVPTLVPTASPSPTTSATATPTATPTPAPLVLSTQTLTFITTGAAADQTTTASEAAYAGTFSATSSTCTNIVAISAPSASGVFTVEPQNAGTCSFAVSDASGQSKTVNVSVTLTSGTVK